MPIEIQLYETAVQKHWEHFVWQSNNGTLFHTRKFLSYHPPERFQDHSLVFREGNKILALLPATERIIDGEKNLASHTGSSYGGFVYPENLSVQLAFDLVESLIEYSRSRGFHRIEMTLPPVVYHARPSHYIDFALYKNGFSYKKREISSVIPLDFPVENILNNFKPEARTACRKSQKMGVEVKKNHDYESFYPILKKNLSMRHNVLPTHTLEELQLLHKLFPERIHQFGAYVDGKMAAGVTNFLCNDRVVLAFYISHDDVFQKYRPVNSLFFEIIKWSIENGYKFLDYGIFTVNEDPNWGLGKFKESFGARGIFRDSYTKTL